MRKRIGPKQRPFRISEVGQRIVAPVELAVRRLEETLAEDAERQRQQQKATRILLSGDAVPALDLVVAAQPAVMAAAADVLVRSREFVARLRRSEDVAEGSWAQAIAPLRIRSKPARRGEKLKFETTIAAHAAWAVQSSATDAPMSRLTDGMAVELIAASHLHFPGGPNAPCPEHRCKRLAVCRNLVELLDARPSPIKLAVRAVAQAAFDAAGALASVCRYLRERHAHAPSDLVQDGKKLAALLRRTDTRLRAVSGDVPVPRRERAPEVTRRAVTLELVLAGFDEVEICALVDDGTALGAKRLKNHRRLVDRYFEEFKAAEKSSENPFKDWRTSWVAERKT
ncbi:MAG: hypothetical protein EOO73_29315 [Myxococcales bacterium]|nr:MAG: hypothetical protein EOO73_29315 [Myxococcales bacterium]